MENTKVYTRFKTRPDCGTRSGYDYHRRVLNEIPCEACTLVERQYHKDRRVRDKAKISAFRKEWRLNHPDAVKPTTVTQEQVIEAYGTDCHLCTEPIDFNASRATGAPGWEKSYHPDHLIPRSKGGPDIIENVRPSHAQCNVRKWATV